MRDVLPHWTAPPDILVLEQPHIHVWRFGLEPGGGVEARLRALMSPEEICRWAQFRFARDRRHFVAAHGILRLLLSLYTGEAPEGIRFVLNSYGKPALPGGSDGQPPAFSLAHSGDTGLLAVGPQDHLGVDIERIHRNIDPLAIAGDFFSPREVKDLHNVPADLQQEAFFHCWTRKEAFIKGKGKGISIPLDSFSVSLRTDEDAALLMSRVDDGDLQRWSLVDLAPGNGFAGALAVDSRHFLVHRWEVSSSRIIRLLDDHEHDDDVAPLLPIHQVLPAGGN